MEAVACENYRRSAPGWAVILVHAIGPAKKVALSELRGIALAAYLVKITNIRSARAWKL